MVFDQQLEVLSAIEGDIKRLFDEHRQRREHWYFHEFVPWEQGRSYVEEPWDVSQCTISEAARTSLVLNLLTEDNLRSGAKHVSERSKKEGFLAVRVEHPDDQQQYRY